MCILFIYIPKAKSRLWDPNQKKNLLTSTSQSRLHPKNMGKFPNKKTPATKAHLAQSAGPKGIFDTTRLAQQSGVVHGMSSMSDGKQLLSGNRTWSLKIPQQILFIDFPIENLHWWISHPRLGGGYIYPGSVTRRQGSSSAQQQAQHHKLCCFQQQLWLWVELSFWGKWMEMVDLPHETMRKIMINGWILRYPFFR